MQDDPAAPLVDLEWYFTDQDFLPFESCITSLDWDEDQTIPKQFGEQWYYPRTYNGVTHIAGLRGDHICGTPDQFLNGGPWPYSGPAIVYDGMHIPLCCNRDVMRDATAGGIEIGGAAGDQVQHFDPAEGGIEIGGAAGDQVQHFDPAEGGIEIGGAAGESHNFTDAAEGGIEIGGAAGDQVQHFDPAEGGIEIGGAAGESHNFTDAAEGGIEIGGAAGDQVQHFDPAEGGIEIGGAAGDQVQHIDPTAGGLQLGGAAGDVMRDPTAGGLQLGGATGDVVTHIDPTAGGLQLGGAVGDVFWITTSGGGACATAVSVARGIQYRVNEPAGATTEWFFYVVAPGTYTFLESTVTGTAPAVTAFKGTSCGSLGTGQNIAQNTATAITTATGNIFLRCLRGSLATAGSWRFILT